MRGEDLHKNYSNSISSRVDRAFATRTVDADSILCRVKLKKIKIVIHSCPARGSATKATV